ncbi:dienelactone hydrolase family protein [Roseisolibacter agri]|uniref:Carboxymethylenebutenolidase n=1 Tax=Roseisolibacter agri TaxID=2014610 RepID=A0AA37PZW9_9BACT|nr:dienelactone hydrolase family protein [Roseisolibacter agri]GLC23814.1 carboxymethylenebutenolidase [Roseisolibacter agri]
MRTTLGVTAVVAAVGIGFAAGRVRPALAVDEHAGHEIGASVTPVRESVRETQPAAGIPASGATAADRIARSPRHGEWVAIRVNATDSVMAWVVYPERRDRAPVVIAIHENTGINTWTRSVADQLAADGFIAIAPDLTTMFRTDDLKADPAPDAGRAAIGKVTPAIGNAILDAVAKYGMALPAALPKYGIVGFCWGGGRSFLHATHAPGLGASVVYYGSPPSADAMAAIKAPVLGLYGGNDARINATIPATDSAMKALGKSYAYQIFDGAGHGFLRAQDSNPANAAAAQQAWPRTIAFLKAQLGK